MKVKMDGFLNKDELRKLAMQNLLKLDLSKKSVFEVQIHERIKKILSNENSGIWAAFWPLRLEPSLQGLWNENFQLLENPKIRFCFPKVHEQNLRFYLPLNSARWSQNSIGVSEPNPDQAQEIAIDAIEGFLIPGLAFSTDGGRLGRGKGFYDRALEKAAGLKIGVGFDCQLFSKIPLEDHDIRLDRIVTERNEIVPAELEKI